MSEQVPRTPKNKPLQDTFSHNRDLLLALSRAAQSIQRARTAEDFYHAVGNEIKSLGGKVAFLILNNDRESFSVAYTSYEPNLIQKVENLLGISALGYQIAFSPGSLFGHTLAGGKAVFIDSISQAIIGALPETVRPLTAPMMHKLNLGQGILAPLRVDNDTLGLLAVSGLSLDEDDVTAMDAFAGQIATGLHNVHLTQLMQNELSARKQAEERLQISTSTYEGIFNSIAEAIFILDENGFFLKVNLSAEKMYGYPPEDFIGRTPEFLSAPEKNDIAKILEYIGQAYLGEPVEFEFLGLRKNGSVFPKIVRLTPGIYFEKKVVIAVGRDVTERKSIEKALFESERYYRALIENATDGILVVNTDGKIRYESPSVARILGYEPAALIGTSAFDLIHPDDLSQIAGAFMEGINIPNFVHRGEYRIQHCNGEWRYFDIVSHYLMNDPVIAGIIINGRDITERKKAERSLMENEKQYRLLAEGMADVVWVLDGKTRRFKYMSPSVEKLLGYTAEEILTKSMDEIIVPDSLTQIDANFPERVHRFFKGDQAVVTELDLVRQWHKNGSIIPTEVATTLVLNEKKELEVIGVSRDVSERNKAEDELRRANKSLEAAHQELQQMFAHEQELARVDGLTGIYNRRYFFELATREFSATIRYQRPLTIILFDIDDFKLVNDNFGHAYGDTILIQIAQIAIAQVRDVDVLARYGGDEFIILLPETDSEHAFIIAERIRESVESTNVGPFIITLSIGVAETVHAPQDQLVEDIIRRADKALYLAKQKGRNNTVIFTEL